MEDLILQCIFLPVTITMFGFEALGKAINENLSVETTVSADGNTPTAESPAPAATGPDAGSTAVAAASGGTAHPAAREAEHAPLSGVQHGTTVQVVSYHPNAAKGCCQG